MRKLIVLLGVLFILSCNNTESNYFDAKKLNIKYDDINIQKLVQNIRDSARFDTNFFITEDVVSFVAIYHQGDSVFSLYIDDSVITQEFTCENRNQSYTTREANMYGFVPFPFWEKFAQK